MNVPAPPPPKEDEEPAPDQRQEFEGVPLALPGIIHAWDGSLPAAGGGTGKYRIYVLGNHERYIAADLFGKPLEFHHELEVSLQTLFGVELPVGDTGRGDRDNEKFRQMVPHSEQFTLQKTFTAINFAPRGDSPPFKAWLFEYTQEKIQFALLVLTPSAPSPAVRQTILTSLETLQVSPQTPRGRPGGAPSSAQPAGPVNF